MARSPPSTISTSSPPGAYKEIASRRSPRPSVSDIEGQHLRFDMGLGRPYKVGLVYTRAAPVPRLRHSPSISHTPLDAAVDPSTAVAEARTSASKVSMPEACSLGLAHPGNILRNLGLQQRHCGPCETAFAGGYRFRHPQRAGAFGVGGANIEMRALPIVADQKGIAAFQPAMDVHDRRAPPIGLRDNAIARLKDETTCRHRLILRHRRRSSERDCMTAASVASAKPPADAQPLALGRQHRMLAARCEKTHQAAGDGLDICYRLAHPACIEDSRNSPPASGVQLSFKYSTRDTRRCARPCG